MKIAPLVKKIIGFNKTNASNGSKINYKLVHTGQHYDSKMSEVFFKELGIPSPDINLEVGSISHAQQTAKIMMAFEPVCLEERIDWVVVFGDVNSTVACTLVASKLGIKVAHVEAGLRSFDRTMPEEINRLVTDALADLLLTPSVDADDNLKKEGIPSSKISLVGNIMIDTLVQNLKAAKSSKLPKKLDLQRNNFAYVTLHRPSNVDDKTKLNLIVNELNVLATQMPVVFPIHPRTKKMLDQFQIQIEKNPNMITLEPIGYLDSICLTEMALFVLTDSGGLQEESTFLKTICLTLRDNTERPITIEQGTNKLTNTVNLSKDIQEIIESERKVGNIPEFWDGDTASRIVKELLEYR
jgi:UDP-N-acetylglucosamine 2-epimerase (non-hydrolysing)